MFTSKTAFARAVSERVAGGREATAQRRGKAGDAEKDGDERSLMRFSAALGALSLK